MSSVRDVTPAAPSTPAGSASVEDLGRAVPERTGQGRARWLRAAERRRVLPIGAVLAVALVACTPSSQDTRSSSELGLPTAEVHTGPLAPSTTAPPAGQPPVSTSPTSPPPTTTAPPATEQTGPVASIAGCPLTGDKHALRARVDALATKSGSAAMIAAAGPSLTLKPLFTAKVRDGSRRGIPVNVVDGSTAERRELVLSTAYGSWSDNGIPWTDDLRFEGWPIRAWDRRLLVLDSSTCEVWEGINLQSPSENFFAFMAGTWYADKLVKWAPGVPSPRSRGSISGSGLPFLPALVRYDEVASGRINHALMVTLPTISTAPPVWPATRNDGKNTDPAAPPMGSWLRLRADADLSELGPQARVVAEALQRHGMILSDSAPHLGIRGEPDVRWNDADLATLEGIPLSAFEVVDTSPLKISDTSWTTR